MRSYQDMLNEYFGGGRNIQRKGFFFSVWLFFKGKKYRERRNKVLSQQCKIRSSVRLRSAMRAAKDSGFFNMIAKDDSWQGAYLPVPFPSEQNQA